ncbi:WD40-repeat-containing domain protein [Melanogaster broomeanus]|nr:WD40-repeat-containing domain protein [Melanogaster broomeanus]
MLAIVTQSGTCLVDPSDLKNPLSSFPVSSSLECSASAWSPDSSQLYLANSTSIKRYTPSESLLEEVYSGSYPVTCLAVKGETSTVFFAAANKVWSLDCALSPGKEPSSLEPHKSSLTAISISNDCTLLASVSTSAVLVHNLTLSSYTPLRGLPDGKPVTCCMFHQHSRTRLLLGIGREVLVYDSTRPSGPLKVIRIPGSSTGNIVAMAASPFSKTLVTAVASNGDVALVDLDKDNGTILKTVTVQNSLTSCAFTAEGAAIYLGTENGKLLILDLRALEKEPKMVTIGDASPIKAINVQKKSTSNVTNAKAKSTSATAKPLEMRTSSTRVHTVSSSPARARSKAGSIGAGVKSPARVTIASKLRGGSGVTPKEKLFSPVRSPLAESRNLGIHAQLSNSRSRMLLASSPLSRRFEALRLQKSEKKGENYEPETRPPSGVSRKSAEQVNKVHHAKPSSSSPNKTGQDAMGHLRVGSGPPESISGHLAARRTRSGSILDGVPKAAGHISPPTRRVVSQSRGDSTSTAQRVTRTTSGATARSRVPSSKQSSRLASNTQQIGERRSTTPDHDEDRNEMSSPDLPREPVTPISLGKNKVKASMMNATSTGMDVLGLGSPEVTKGDGRKGKEREVDVKKARFVRYQGGAESDRKSDDGQQAEAGFETLASEERDEARRQELSMQVSPRRPTVPPTWLPSPHRPSSANLNMNVAAQDFLRNIVRDVMYDFQRETKAEMMGLHLDLVRMGRGWRRELREVLGEEWGGEIQQLREENKRLREENERLRRGY